MDYQDHIDGLLERYLHLLHEYTSLRDELTTLQTGMYQNIARANFAAERGLRFGQDHYDDRMQASRRLAISCEDQNEDHSDQAQAQNQEPSEIQDSRRDHHHHDHHIPRFTVITPACSAAPAAEDSESSVHIPNNNPPHHPEAEAKAEADGSVEQDATDNDAAQDDADADDDDKLAGNRSRRPPKRDDPLRWFGLLTPAPLRQAQTQSIRAVEHVIPRLASVDAEMREVEIEVRRARKRRAKAEATASATAVTVTAS
ncbi:hypothetical protein ONZ43_g748 [Nemania bipapillata]|uniref:Uncharacterized protein n=1 Tax=Nemania bipapillata TaxID=110536 RepID=A0ACC2J6Z0_9PEZI|nr:hypothetical protein ONZ43_g748 [Nemania bipapillata]